MSGGVDSAVAALLLVRQGWDVVGLHLKLHDAPLDEGETRSCCSLDESLDARAICAQLGVPFYVLDFREAFAAQVVDYFVSAYAEGLTPNPCVMCNRTLKHAMLLQKAREFGCTRLATGHYAKIRPNPQSGQLELLRPRDRAKDQTYFLFHLKAELLAWLEHPLAALEKTQVRAMAKTLGFATWNKADSQQICFAPKDYRGFIAPRLPSAALQPGRFVDLQGRDLGPCRGVAFYTVGQRRGLGLAASRPQYVVALRPQSGQVVLGPAEALFACSLTLAQVNWLRPPPAGGGPLRACVKIRSSHPGEQATITPLGGERARVVFQSPVRAIAPGQAAVFYEGDVVLGGGWIERPPQSLLQEER